MAVLAVTLFALLCLPCVVAVILCADEIFERAGVRWRARRSRRDLKRLDRRLDSGAPIPAPRQEVEFRPGIEQIAADLRRLHRQRSSGPTTESSAWLTAVQRAYDDRLCLACSSLGVDHHLRDLDGLDREIERVRVEGELEAAGLALRAANQLPPDRHS
jgi:hypothetical protein